MGEWVTRLARFMSSRSTAIEHPTTVLHMRSSRGILGETTSPYRLLDQRGQQYPWRRIAIFVGLLVVLFLLFGDEGRWDSVFGRTPLGA